MQVQEQSLCALLLVSTPFLFALLTDGEQASIIGRILLEESPKILETVSPILETL